MALDDGIARISIPVRFIDGPWDGTVRSFRFRPRADGTTHPTKSLNAGRDATAGGWEGIYGCVKNADGTYTGRWRAKIRKRNHG